MLQNEASSRTVVYAPKQSLQCSFDRDIYFHFLRNKKQYRTQDSLTSIELYLDHNIQFSYLVLSCQQKLHKHYKHKTSWRKPQGLPAGFHWPTFSPSLAKRSLITPKTKLNYPLGRAVCFFSILHNGKKQKKPPHEAPQKREI